MALQAARELLENAAGSLPAAILAALPSGFYDYLVTGGLRIDHVDPQRMLCSITVPHRLLSHGGVLDNGVTASLVDIIGSAAFFAAGCPTTGVSVDISISYLEAAYADNNGNFLDSGAVASLVDIMGSAALFAAGYPTTGVSTDINISYLDAAHVDTQDAWARALEVGPMHASIFCAVGHYAFLSRAK